MSRELLKQKAFETRELYLRGMISREEAKALIDPYLEQFNLFSRNVAKKYDQKPKQVSFASFTRL